MAMEAMVMAMEVMAVRSVSDDGEADDGGDGDGGDREFPAMLLAMLLAMLVTVAMGAAGHGANHLEVAAPPPMLSPERLAGVGHRTRAAFINNITLKLRHGDPCTAPQPQDSPVGMPVEYKIERLSTFLAWLWCFHGRQVCMSTLRTLMERPEWGVRIRDPEPNMVWICCMLPDMSIFLVRDL